MLIKFILNAFFQYSLSVSAKKFPTEYKMHLRKNISPVICLKSSDKDSHMKNLKHGIKILNTQTSANRYLNLCCNQVL